MGNYKIKSLYSGAGIIVTYKCSASCIHCCYSASPNRSGDYISKETADKIFALLKKTGCNSVHIGGGEPFMDFDRLLEVCKSAVKNKVSVDYIETNASWFTNDYTVSEKLKKLTDAGVDCLLISIDPFHNEFIPYARVKSLIKCCDKNGMGTFLWQAKYERVIRKLDENETHSLDEYISKFGNDFIEATADNYGLNFNGRALRIIENSQKFPRYSYEHFLLNESRCSDIIKSLQHFHVDLNGDLIPPSCNGFRANIFDLCGKGLDGEKYINFMSVINGGLNMLYKTAQDIGFIPANDGYASKCAFCFDMKKYIYDSLMLKDGTEPCDIGPAGFFEES
ncbi:MAG: radical SAM protein [Oscillospiraceae bacterium]|nr:radical SAM protein [Oscillospiraceae bacterium]